MPVLQTPLQQIDEAFVTMLACPKCRGDLRLDGQSLKCIDCGGTYAIEDGVPILTNELEESIGQLDYQRAFFNHQFAAMSEYNLLNWHRSYLKRIFTAAGVSARRKGRYLDIGSGGIAYTVIEAARLGWDAVGCDLSIEGIRNAIAFAKDQGVQDRTKFVVCSAEALPFKPGMFDAISCIAVLEHLVRDDLAAGEIGRVCVPGGRFFVTVPNSWLRTNLIFWLPSWINDRAHRHLRHYSRRSLAKLFEPAFGDLTPAHTARTIKGLQLALPMLRIRSNALWWWLERIDLTNPQSPWGAQLHMSGVRR